MNFQDSPLDTKLASPLVAAAVISLSLASCDRKPSGAPSPGGESTPVELSAPDPTPDPDTETVQDSSEAPDPEPPAPKGALLEMKESADGKTITVTGHLSSEYQVKDLADNLKYAFPDLTIVSEVKFAPEASEVVWGNRVTDLLVPLVTTVDEAYFHYQNGITTVGGTVDNRGTINQIEKLTSYVMEADDSRGITNKLKVKSP